MEATASRVQISCGVFGGIDGLDPEAIHRFVVGEDTEPHLLTPDAAAKELGDPFATLLLLKGVFPQTADEVFEKLAAAAGPDDPLSERHSFVLGEGSHLRDTPEASATLRFLVSTGFGPDGPDVIVSAFHPLGSDVELMAWDRLSGGFNYYRTVSDPPAWAFAGNSRHALSDPTQGNGPFESHTSGAILMKELEIPWNNWHSFEAEIPAEVFPAGDERRTHPWFTEKQGAEDCETAVAIPSMRRWARARFERVAEAGGEIEGPRRILEQVLGTPTVNLISSRAESSDPDGKNGVKIPPSFFVSINALTSPAIGLSPASEFPVPTDIYLTSVERLGLRLVDDRAGFEQKGDTRFAFLVPERAREDDILLEQAIETGLISPRLAAALLMVDFPNPIFSKRREALLDHVPETASIADEKNDFSQRMADAILAVAAETPEGSPEREFAERWEVGEDFTGPFDALLSAYLSAVAARAASQDGFDDYMRLADSRRQKADEDLPIIEFPLLFPRADIPAVAREMQPDGTVTEVAA